MKVSGRVLRDVDVLREIVYNIAKTDVFFTPINLFHT